MADQEQLRRRMAMEEEEAAEPGHSEQLSTVGGKPRMSVRAVSPDMSEPIEDAPGSESGFADSVFSPHTAIGAGVHGLTQGSTLGFGDEAMGAASAAGDAISDALDARERVADAKRRGTYDPSAATPQEREDLAEEQSGPSLVSRYERNRDQFRASNETADKEHGGAYFAGDLLGSFAVPMPGSTAKGMGKVLAYGKQGLKLGLANGLGRSNSDLTKGDFGGALRDMGSGGLSGALTAGLLGAGAAKLDPFLERAAQKRAYKALDPELEAIRRALGQRATSDELADEARRLGKRALDENVVPTGALERWASPETLANRAKMGMRDAGQLKGAMVDIAQDALGGRPVDAEAIARGIEKQALEANKSAANQALARALMREAEGVRKAGIGRALAGGEVNMTLPEAEAEKTAMQRAAKYVDAGQRGGATEEAKRIAARVAKQATEGAIESGLGPEDLAQFIASKNRYADMASLVDAAGERAAGQGPIHALMHHGPTAAAASAVLRGRAAPAAARTLRNLSQSADSGSLVSQSPLAVYLDLLKESDDGKR